MAPVGMFLLLYLTGSVIARKPPPENCTCPCSQLPHVELTELPKASNCCQGVGKYRYTCTDGYARKAGTSYFIKCDNNQWSKPNLICKQRDPELPSLVQTHIDVSCLLEDLDYVHCSWDGQNTPEVNYTFYSRFHWDNFKECTFYTSEKGSTTGCKQPYNKLETQRFEPFYTKLTYDNDSFLNEHSLKTKVKLNAPVNVTVKNDSNLCFYWNHTNGWYKCLENEVRYRTNYNKWESSRFSMERPSYCSNLPSGSSRYELQVRFRVASYCGESIYLSDWSQPVYWGSMKNSSTLSTDTPRGSGPMSVWSVVFSVVGTCIVLLVLITLVHHDRIRIILVPIVPKPGKNLNEILIHGNVEEWLHISKDLKEGFKADYNERACAVHEYSRVPQSASESSDSSSSFSVTTDQTDCSVATSAN